MEQPRDSAPLGAFHSGRGTLFRLLTTVARRCHVRLFEADGRVRSEHPMSEIGGGIFELELAGPQQQLLYKFVLDGRELPDPYARFLPLGVHGPAAVGPSRYRWRHSCVSRPLREHVIYELHVGTFTEEGTYRAASARLPDLADLGVTAIELMPLSSFAGGRGWGYDGVAHFAPHAAYGTPDELRAFVDQAHGAGLSVLLDVVYNHFGASGNYLAAYSPRYFSAATKNAWGDAPDFEDPLMRRYALDNARYWLTEFRFDGLRLDATHAIVDRSWPHVLRELSDEVSRLEPRRLLIAEDERNDPSLVSTFGLDAVWADDFHHQVRVLLTGEREGYYAAYEPSVERLADTIRSGWLFAGQLYPPTGQPRGKDASRLPADAFVYCIQNHDQIGNRALGDRLNAAVSIDAYCAVSALLATLPMTPLLFMGQEWAATTPFQFFTDHDEELGRLVSEGRLNEFRHFESFRDPDARRRIPDPQAPETFLRSRLRWEERARGEHRRVLELYRSLLRLRQIDPVFKSSGREQLEVGAHGPVLVVRRWSAEGDRLLLVNFDSAAVDLDGLAAVVSGRPVLLRTDDRLPAPGAIPGHTAILLGSQ
jgi:maltooligosyltrehalose trehalohydrolase